MSLADNTLGNRARPELRARMAAAVKRQGLPLLAAIYLLMVMLPVGFDLGSLYLTNLRVYLLIVLVPVGIKIMSGAAGRLLATDILFVLHMAWASVAIAVNNPAMVVGNIGSVSVEFLGGYGVARLAIRNRSDFVAVCRWLGILVALTVPLAIYESRTDAPLLIRFIDSLPMLRSEPDIAYEQRMGLFRAQVFLAHPIHYGLFCSTVFSLVFLGLKGEMPDLRRWFLAAMVALATFLSLSSGALLPLMIQIGLLIWLALFERSGKPWLILSLLFAMAWITVDLLSNRSPLMVFISYATFSGHNAYWRALIFEWGMQNVWSSPIFGIGFHDWFRPAFMNHASVDNFWLLNAMRYGIPAFLLLAAGYAWGCVLILRARLDHDAELIRLRRAWAFTMVGLTFTLTTVHVWTAVYSFVFFIFGSGFWLIFEDRPQQDAPATTGRAGRDRQRVEAGPAAIPAMVAESDSDPETPGSPYTRFPRLARRQTARIISPDPSKPGRAGADNIDK